jgi:NAD(P)H-dependent flavin oxidoreductase YrpB (nitropropane dioxygenase family)
MPRAFLIDRLGTDVPIIQAAMANAASPALAAAVSNAGAFGMLQFGWREPDEIREQISAIRRLTQRGFGAGFLLDRPQHERLEVALEAGVQEGQGIGLVSRTQNAADIVREIAEEARSVIARLAAAG